LAVLHLRCDVSEVNGHTLRQLHLDFWAILRCRGIFPQEPAAKPTRIFDADASVAQQAFVARKILSLGRVMQIDILPVREWEFQLTHGIRGAGELPDANMGLTRLD